MLQPERKLRIAIVESDKAKRQRLSELAANLSQFGDVDLLTASTGNEAIYLFDSHHPDLFIINSQISGITGREIYRWIRAHETERHTGIIVIGGFKGDEDKLSIACLTQGADDFLCNDYTPDEFQARVNTVLRLKFMTDELRRVNYKLKVLTLTDELTGMANMRCFRDHFARTFKRCADRETGLAVIMLDLDHFKQINDKNNHLVGSYVLSEAGKLIREAKVIGPEDLAARYGGDEFIICSEVSEITYALHKAMAIRELIESAVFKYDGNSVSLTASIGVSWVNPGFHGPKNDIIKLADAMLYRSKNMGRNRVSGMELRYPINFDFIGEGQGLSSDPEPIALKRGGSSA